MSSEEVARKNAAETEAAQKEAEEKEAARKEAAKKEVLLLTRALTQAWRRPSAPLAAALGSLSLVPPTSRLFSLHAVVHDRA